LKSTTTFSVLKNPSDQEATTLLAQAGSAGLRGIEDHSGNVYLWPYGEGTHMMMAGLLGIPYDPAADYVDELTGKTFYIRSLDDWRTRERRRAEPGSFTRKCRLTSSGPDAMTSGNRLDEKREL
jgi:hypothetical protein